MATMNNCIASKEKVLERCAPEPNTGCWLWLGVADKDGYGSFSYCRRFHMVAHRYSYLAFIGEIPKGLFVCHTCDTRSCVNPEHLFLADHKANMADMYFKNRGRKSFGSSHYSTKFTEAQIIKIREEYSWRKNTCKMLGKKYGVSEAAIYGIVSRSNWRHV